MKHPYSEILHAIADGKEIQARQSNGWKDTGDYSVFNAVLMTNKKDALQPEDYRIKPATITINGVECEAPAENDYNWLRVHTQISQKTITFATTEARDAAYAALIKPFGEQV